MSKLKPTGIADHYCYLPSRMLHPVCTDAVNLSFIISQDKDALTLHAVSSVAFNVRMDP